jgi:hypothetical protein
MRHLYGNRFQDDYECPCGLIIEISDGMVLDGRTGKEMVMEKIDPPEDVEPLPELGDIAWHYRSKTLWVGQSPAGYDYEFDPRKKEVRRITSENERKRIVRYAISHGNTAAARAHEVPAKTVENLRARKKEPE